jgi:hypothetical protein
MIGPNKLLLKFGVLPLPSPPVLQPHEVSFSKQQGLLLSFLPEL